MKRDNVVPVHQAHTLRGHRLLPRGGGVRILPAILAIAVIAAVILGNWGSGRVAAFAPANPIFALTNNNMLLRFNADTPGTILSSTAVTGLTSGDTLAGIDFRPATGQLYGLAGNGATVRLYVINPSTGAATQVGGTIALPQSAGIVDPETDFGFDFNPTVDRIRVVANNRDNFRLNPDTGAVAGADTALTAGAVVTGAAYDRNFGGTTQTTLYGIDANTDQLVTIGGINSTPSPNTGAVIAVGNLGVNTAARVGFDIAGDAPGSAYASLGVGGASGFYTINLTTGAATLVSAIGTGATPIVDIAVAPAGVLRFTTPTYTVSEAGAAASITVNRTGGSFGAVSVTVSTANGSATAGQDYTATTTTLTFADGVTSQTFSIPILNDTSVEGNETVILNFSNYVGCGLTGPSGLLTITDDDDGVCNIWAIDNNNNLLRFSNDTPGTIAATLPVTGLAAGEKLAGIDFRPATGALYALGVAGATGRLYTLTLATGAATLIGVAFTLPQSAGVGAGIDYGFDFNPTVDRIRVVADSRDNFRLNPDTGAVAGADTALTAGAVVVGAAYDRNFIASPPQPPTATTLYAIDANTDQLVTIGGINSTPSPNTGAVTAIGNLGFNTSTLVGFDITNGAEGTPYASLTVGGQSGLYTINLTTGAATPVGVIGSGSPITDIATAPAGTVQFSVSSYIVSETAGTATITVTRTAGRCGAITVTASTSDGTATAPGDYAATSVALTFPDPVTSRTFTIPIVNDGLLEADETINLTLSANVGGRIAAPATATLTIADDDTFPFTYNLADTLACTGPGNTITGTFTLTNNSAAPVAAAAAAALPGGLLANPGSCTSNVGSCSVVSPVAVSFTATLAPGQTATVSYLAQVGDLVASGTVLSSNLTVSFGGRPPLSASASVTVNCPVAGPGLPLPAASEASDQKAGSVLFYNLYSSGATNSNSQNMRIALTNTHQSLSTAVHLFFVDGASCNVADSFICLTPNQTTTFLASDLDPGTTGYFLAVASDSSGCPRNFNYLIGDEFVKLSTGHAANLGAEAFQALPGGLPFCNANSVTATLNFDGISYNRVPRVVAVSNIPSRADGNDTQLVLNRIGGNLATGASTLGSIFGILYDDAEAALSFSVSGGCQLRGSLSNSFPRTTPRIENFISAGRSGWMKLYSQSDIGLLGAVLNVNPNAGAQASAFNQGHNLHKLTLSASSSLTIPIFPPGC